MKTIQTKITYDLYDVKCDADYTQFRFTQYFFFLQKRERKHIAACFLLLE